MRTMSRKRSLLIILLMVSSVLPLLITFPIAKASETTIPVSHNFDDVWMTEAGNIFSSTSMVVILDEEIGLHSFLRFQDIPLSKTSKINVATLYVFAGEVQVTPDPGSSVTIYGIDEPDCAPFTSDGSLWSLSRPYTLASVNWNLTEWGPGWHMVNVTSIVKELINQYAWVTNNSLGLQILGASDSGQESRSFEDYYHPYHDAQAKLYIQYDVAPGTPPGLPDSAVWEETYGEWDIWNYTVIEDLNYTEMTQTGSLGKLHVFNETCFNWTDINKSTTNVALGYFVNLTGPNPLNNFEMDFNFTQNIDIAHGSQKDPGGFFVCGELDIIGSINDVRPENEVVLMEIYTHSDDYYKFLPRFYGTGPVTGNYTGTLLKNTWYMGKVILSGTLWRMEIRNMDGSYKTSADVTLPRVQDINAIMPFACAESVAGSQVDGWMTKDPGVVLSEFYLVDENGTVIDTWTQGGENFTDIDDLKDFVDDYVDPEGGDPLDPDPGTGWEEEGPFTRFRMRLYILIIGLGCVFTPLWAMAYKKFDAVGYAWCFIIMVLGVGLLWGLTGI